MSEPLSPSPQQLASLLLRTAQLPWPTTEAERLAYFAALGWHDTQGEVTDDGSDSAFRRFTTSLPEVDGDSSAFREDHLGFSLSCYSERGEDRPAARAGFAAVREQLSSALGDPVEEWGSLHQPACLWQPGILSLEMYCFQRGSSSVMVGLSHTERSAANDAAH